MGMAKLKAVIMAHDETYLSVARKADMSLSSLANKINERTVWTDRDMKAVSKVLNLTRDEFMEIFFEDLSQ